MAIFTDYGKLNFLRWSVRLGGRRPYLTDYYGATGSLRRDLGNGVFDTKRWQQALDLANIIPSHDWVTVDVDRRFGGQGPAPTERDGEQRTSKNVAEQRDHQAAQPHLSSSGWSRRAAAIFSRIYRAPAAY